jgi:hypothetical protein
VFCLLSLCSIAVFFSFVCFLLEGCIPFKRDTELLTSVSRSEEEMVEEMGEPVSKVLKETDPDKSRFLTNPTLAFSGLKPKGHPSSACIPNQSSGFTHILKISKCQGETKKKKKKKKNQ